MLRRCTDSVQCRLPDSILGPPKVTSVFFLGGDIFRYLATKKGWVASDFFLRRQKKGGGGGVLFSDFVLWRIIAILRKIFFKRIVCCKMPCFF